MKCVKTTRHSFYILLSCALKLSPNALKSVFLFKLMASQRQRNFSSKIQDVFFIIASTLLKSPDNHQDKMLAVRKYTLRIYVTSWVRGRGRE